MDGLLVTKRTLVMSFLSDPLRKGYELMILTERDSQNPNPFGEKSR